MKLLTAMRQDNAFRASVEYSLVSARKKGLPPSGSTMGKSVTTSRRVFFAASWMGSLSPNVIDLDCGAPIIPRIVIVLPNLLFEIFLVLLRAAHCLMLMAADWFCFPGEPFPGVSTR